jgi:hypothetical protein
MSPEPVTVNLPPAWRKPIDGPGMPEPLIPPPAEQLLEQVWDEFADPFTNTVTVTIGRLRRKLGDPPVITTTPGVGYGIAS